MRFLPLLLFWSTPAAAFVVMTHPSITSSSLLHQHLNEIDEMCIENVANLCLTDLECDLEEYDALLNSLEEQRDLHQERVEALNRVLDQLRGHESPAAENSLQGKLSM